MRIVLVSKGASDIQKWIRVAKTLRHSIEGGVDVCIVTSFEFDGECPEWLRVVNAYRGFAKESDRFDRFGTGAKLAEQAAFVSPTAYRSDTRHIFASHPESELGVEQLFLTRAAIDLVREFEPDFMFLAGAGTLIRTVFFSVGRALGVAAFRVLRAHHMNLARTGVRYFFCRNDLGATDHGGNALFSHDPVAVRAYADEFLSDVKRHAHRFDKHSRTVGRYKRVSRPGFGIWKDVARYVLQGLGGSALSRQVAKSKVACRLRAIRQRRLFDDPGAITGPYVLFPLNVPTDAQLRLRAREFADIESVIGLVASNLPLGHDLVVKIHPGNPGMLKTSAMQRLRAAYPSMKFVSPDAVLFDLISSAFAIIVVNGNSALEAAMFDVPCIYLGSSYYSKLPNCIGLKGFEELEGIVGNLVKGGVSYEERQVREVVEDFYYCTYPTIDQSRTVREDTQGTIADGIVRLLSLSR